MDAYQPPGPYMRPPPGALPPADPYHQYYQHQVRPPGPSPTQPGGPAAWYSNQFHNPHSPSPPPPPQQQWGPPPPHHPQGEPYSSPAYPPFPTQSHQPPFNAGANGNSQFPPPAGPQPPPPHPLANQEWGNPNWGHQQAHSNADDWAVKAREWAAANEDPHSQFPPNQTFGQAFPQYFNQDVHQQQAAPGLSYQQFPVQHTQPDSYPNPAIHQQEVPYSYSSVAGKEESGNATQHHEVQISVPDGGGPVHAEQQMQYGYGDQIAAPPSDHSAWPPHAATGVVYPPIPPSSVPSMPQHDSSMAVSGHTMPPFGRFPPPNVQPVGYAFGTKPPPHPVAAFMDDSYAASSVPPKKAPVPNWLKEELLKKKASLGRPSSGSFEERESLDDDVLYKPPAEVDQHDDKRFSLSKLSDEEEEEEEEDEDEIDPARAAAINSEIKRVLTEVLKKVTDELFDEIATKVINEDEAIPKDDSVKSSSLISAADPMHKASAKILVSVEGAHQKAGSGSPADVLGLGSYASDDDDDDDGDTDAAPNADANGSDGVESLGIGLRNDVNQQPSTEKLPEPKAVVNARVDPEVEVGDKSPENNKASLDQMLSYRRNDDEAGSNKNLDISSSTGLDDGTSGSRTNHPERTDSEKDSILHEHHRKDSNKRNGKDLSGDVSRDRSRTDETRTVKEKVDSQNGSEDRMKQSDIKSGEKVKGLESNKKSTDVHVKKDSRDTEKPQRTDSKEDRSPEGNTLLHQVMSPLMIQEGSLLQEEGTGHHLREGPEEDMLLRGHHIASILNASILYTLLMTPPGQSGQDPDPPADAIGLELRQLVRDGSQEDRTLQCCAELCPKIKRSFISVKSNVKQRLRDSEGCDGSGVKDDEKRSHVFFFLHTHFPSLRRLSASSSTSGVSGLRAGLLTVWLSGFLLIALSFYGTQLLSSSSLDDRFRFSSFSRDPVSPKITIFTALSVSSFEEDHSQALLVIRSWLALSSQIKVVIFTQHNSSSSSAASSFADKFGSRLLLDSTIDFTFLGTPFLHSMLEKSKAYKSDIAVLMDPETLLLPDFISSLTYAHSLDRDWLLVSSPSVYIPRFPLHWDETGRFWRQNNGKRVRFGELQKMKSNSSEAKMIMAWNKNVDLPLQCGVFPPFLYQRGTHNQWIVNEAMSCQRRFVFDATSTISSFFLRSHDYVSQLKSRNWEYLGNAHLGKLYGSLFFSDNKSPSLPKLLKCNKRFMFVTASDLSVPESYNVGFRRREKISACISRSKSRSLKLESVQKDQTLPLLKFPFHLESLLPLVADKNRTVILSIAGFSYKDMLMSWVCKLRRLEVPNFLVCALDDETYQFSILQGLPVFFDPYAPKNISFNDCHFGSKCFQRVTKVKSRTVLKILKLGYNVLLSDVDVYWFKNPLPMLHSFGPSVLAAQSDEYNTTVPINRPRRLNSGFYFARSDNSTIAAMEKVVKHAATSGLSEQPSFYDTLCGEGGIHRLGDDRCVEPETNLTVCFLDRNLFPNGAYGDLWLKEDVRAECEKKHCYVLHNNWISGRLKKLQRQMMKEYKITRNHIKSLLAELFLGATDTSSTATQWTMAEIINNRKVLERLREEIDSVIGKTRLIQETDLPNLPYLQAIVKEGLRLHPPTPLIVRELDEGCDIGGFYAPKNTTLVVNAYAMMRDSGSWEDPDEFKPERFLASLTREDEEIKEKTLNYLPFGSGRRGCTGENLGSIFVGTAIGVMVQCFDWEVNGDKVNMEEAAGRFFLTMAHPLICTPLPRTLNPSPSNLERLSS
ncbi:unnamed protein product [Microthlaspi erraticum]|uniref:Nucleotide-diphospho-sugar transferase domain-containing protein n=1 Tax=Microthlaspi erraticum TaxID=1685480 RepID=A0A6D2HZ50_9BRAS|nr:unnamed protein product [Microthlaspi erraticum]